MKIKPFKKFVLMNQLTLSLLALESLAFLVFNFVCTESTAAGYVTHEALADQTDTSQLPDRHKDTGYTLYRHRTL